MRFFRRLLLALTLGLNVNAAEPTATPDWPQWRGPNRDGVSLEKDWLTQWPADGPKVLWKANIGAGYACLVVRGNRLYTLGNIKDEDVVSCLNTDDGSVVWQFKYKAPLDPNSYSGGPSATPTLDENRVYTFSKNGQLYCLDAATGKELWSKNAPKETGALAPNWGFAGSVLIAGDKAILNVGLYGWAVHKLTGETVWKSPALPLGFAKKGPSGYASPLLVNPETVGLMCSNALHLVQVNDGKLLAKYPWATNFGENTPDPVRVGEQVFISSGHGLGGTLLKIEGDKITPLWKNLKFGNHLNSALLHDGYLYGFDGTIHRSPGSFNCVDAKTGEIKWTKPNFKGSAVLAGDKLLILMLDGVLVLAEASPKEFKELARAQVVSKSWTMPILCNGRIYARSASGDVVCLDVRVK